MPLQNAPLIAFNRGRVSNHALARIDLKRLALSAEVQTNWLPRSLGPMSLRPGLQYIDSTRNDAFAKNIPFVFSTSDTAIVELTDAVMRVRVSEAVITRVSVSSAVTNGTFNSDLSGWTSADESGTTSSWLTGGYMKLVGTKFNAAKRQQQVTVSGGDAGKEHALHIAIARGAVTLRVGTTAGTDNYVEETVLRNGVHSIAFTPAGNFYIELSSRAQAAVLVDSVAIEAAGAMELTSPWMLASLSKLRWTQSGDVIFVACDGVQQRRIERHATRSWSLVLYESDDGPMRIVNTGVNTLTPSAIEGDITVTALQNLFKSTHVGSLWRLTSVGQKVTLIATGENQFSDPIKVTGVSGGRQFNIDIAGTFVATVTLQRSVGDVGSWVDINTYASSTTYNDGLDNQIIYYRIGVKTGGYTSGTATVGLTYSAGSITGTFRITGFTDQKTVSAAVVRSLGGTTASTDWAEGVWSDRRGWPGAVALYEGRLWWIGKNWSIGSVSDAFDSFDDLIEGDKAPIIRTIGEGPVDKINWVLPMQRLILGAEGAEISARSTSFDEPLTPINFNLKEASTQGSAAIGAVKVDTFGLYVQRCGTRIYELEYDVQRQDYASNELTILCPEIGEPGVSGMAVQRQPDSRVHCWKSDGTVALALFNPAENIRCLVDIVTDGVIEDAFTLPRAGEDAVYYVVKRTINGSTRRYLEKWAMLNECVGGTLNKQADAFKIYTGPAVTTITGLSHLEGESVVVWGDGKDLGTKTVSGGQISGLSQAVSNAVIGLPYTAQFKSTKLEYAAALGTALGQPQQISKVALILVNSHAQGVKFGPDFDHLANLPLVEAGKIVDPDSIWLSYDFDAVPFPSDNSSVDARLCLQAQAPRPCTVSAAIIGVVTDDQAP